MTYVVHMYDATEGIGQHGALQMMSPFFAPWKDAMQSWGRLIYDNPAIGGLMLRIGQTPDMVSHNHRPE